MIDGTYDVEAKTRLGKKSGSLVLTTNDGACDADVYVMDKTLHLQGTVEGDEVTFEGSIKAPFPIGKVNYTMACTVVGDEITGTCKAKKFPFEIHGTRVQ